MKVHVGEFLAITAVLASAGLAAPGCGVEKVSEESGDSGAGASGGDDGGGSGGDGGSSGDGGGGSSGDGGSAEAGSDAAAGADGGVPDASDPGDGGGADATADGAVADADMGDAGPMCFGDETTLTVPDAGVEGFSHCLDLPSGSCEGVGNPLGSVCATAEFEVRPGVFEAMLECLKDIDVTNDADAGDAGNPFCLISTSEAAAACRAEAIAGACPLEKPVDGGAADGGVGLDCESITEGCADVSEEHCAAVEGAFLDLPLSVFPNCYESGLTFLDCGEAFQRCVADPFAE